MNKINVLGVKIDEVTLDQSVDLVEQWLKTKSKHYIVTPNIEFIMLAQKDQEFKKILNQADLAIPDSSRFDLVDDIQHTHNIYKRIMLWTMLFMPSVKKNSTSNAFPVTTGTDLMESLIEVSNRKGYTIGFLGGRKGVAERLQDCLKHKYPNIRIVFTDSSMVVGRDGAILNDEYGMTNEGLKQEGSHNSLFTIHHSKIDILFVAFGHGKQEKWIARNLDKSNVKIMIGVGGAFDYLSGEVVRAPKWVRTIGFEWLFRLIIQPWRIKRFGELVKFTFKIFNEKPAN